MKKFQKEGYPEKRMSCTGEPGTIERIRTIEKNETKLIRGGYMKILIVDDNSNNLYMLDVLLKGAGYVTATAKNGIEALHQLHDDHFDGIVSDILMPLMDGFYLIRECKKDPCLQQVPFIFYTATYTEKEDQEFGLSLGAIRYIIKPAEPEEFLRQIKEALSDHSHFPRDYSVQPVLDEAAFRREYNQRADRKLLGKILSIDENREIR